MHRLLFSLLVIGSLNACTGFPQAQPGPRASVYKYAGSVQCGGGGMPLSTMIRQLSDGGVPVLDASCGTDGKMYIAVCGAADGRIGIFDVAEDKLPAAATLGFAPLRDLPEATRTACPTAR